MHTANRIRLTRSMLLGAAALLVSTAPPLAVAADTGIAATL